MKIEQRKLKGRDMFLRNIYMSILSVGMLFVISETSSLNINGAFYYIFLSVSLTSGLLLLIISYLDRVRAIKYLLSLDFFLVFGLAPFLIPAIGHFLYFRSASYIPFAVGAYILTLITWCMREVYWQSKAIESTKFMQKEFTELETYIEMRDPVKTELKERPIFIGSSFIEKFFAIFVAIITVVGPTVGAFGADFAGHGAMLTLLSVLSSFFAFKFFGRLSAWAYTTYRIWKLERQTGKPVYLSND